MNVTDAIGTLRSMVTDLDQLEVDLEGTDPEFQLRDSHTALQQATEALRADLARLESGTFD